MIKEARYSASITQQQQRLCVFVCPAVTLGLTALFILMLFKFVLVRFSVQTLQRRRLSAVTGGRLSVVSHQQFVFLFVCLLCFSAHIKMNLESVQTGLKLISIQRNCL